MSNVLSRALNPSYDTGGSFAKRTLWYFVNLGVLYNPWIPLSLPRIWALRLFGAQVGRHVSIKPQVKVKFPWKLALGDGASIGEECWIDNLDHVEIGNKVRVSQRTYLCTGNHDWSSKDVALRTAPISIGDGAWIGAGVLVAPGSRIGRECVVTMGSLVKGELPPGTICGGTPAVPLRDRRHKE